MQPQGRTVQIESQKFVHSSKHTTNERTKRLTEQGQIKRQQQTPLANGRRKEEQQQQAGVDYQWCVKLVTFAAKWTHTHNRMGNKLYVVDP